jgi:hypothetical protein
MAAMADLEAVEAVEAVVGVAQRPEFPPEAVEAVDTVAVKAATAHNHALLQEEEVAEVVAITPVLASQLVKISGAAVLHKIKTAT